MPLYHGPLVSIKIGATTYNVSKTLLCKHSPYFTAMFDSKFKEGDQQLAELEELDGVVSNRSFQMLLQWMYSGQVFLRNESLTDRISAMIEFARLADMLNVSNVESQIMEYIKATILANPPDCWLRNPEKYALHITPGHIHAATRLPKGQVVRALFAKAAVYAYIRSNDFRFSKEIRDIPDFAADLLEELKPAINSVRVQSYLYIFQDPFSGEMMEFQP